MARHVAIVGTLTIASGQTDSPALSTVAKPKIALGVAIDLVIYAPSALTGTVSVQVSPIEEPDSADWRTASVAGTPVTIAAGAAEVVPVVAARDLRIHSSGAEGADRSFIVLAQYDPAL